MSRKWRRALVRAARRVWFRLQARGIPLVYDTTYERGTFGVPLDPLRGEKVLASLDDAGLLSRRALWAPRSASFENLLRVHTPEYLHRVQEPETLSRICGVSMTAAEAEAAVDLQRLMVGGTIQATRLALQTGGLTAHLGGGFHHALPEKGMGFCVFNDIAVAIRRLRGRGFGDPILVVDLDVHDGNGTRAIFSGDATVHTYSVHNEHWGPTEAVASTSIALGAGVDDAKLLEVLRDTLPSLVKSFRPRLVIYLAGTDGAQDDRLGNWQLSEAGLFERDRLVAGLVRRKARACPLVVLLAGGYGPRAWRYTARFLLWAASGRPLEPPPEQALTLERFRRLGHTLGDAARPDDGLAFELTEEDLVGLAPGASPAPRFLGYYSRHEVELLLERSGILAQMRAKGFRRLRVELDDRDGAGSTIRVLSEGEPESVLMELRAERRRVAPDMEVIALEWLLLQNPQMEFSPARPRPPGQQHPGLGLLRDIMGWLLVVCEQHGLDGVAFTAAHYHIAAQSRRLVKLLRPADEARMRALADALEGVSLAEATAAVAGGRVVDGTGAPVPWTPVSTLLPVSQRARVLVSGPDYETEVEREQARLDFRLEPVPAGPEIH